MGWLVALGILTVLAWIPLGITGEYSEAGLTAKLILGPVKLSLYPRPPKKEKPEKTQPMKEPEAPLKPAAEASKETPETVPEPRETGGSWKDFLPLVKLGGALLGDVRRKLRVNVLVLKLTLAAEDPCDLAVNYGRAWSALGNLIPQLERLFVIKKRDMEVRCDFSASEPSIYARMDLTITLGRTLALAAVYGVRALKEFLTIRKNRKGGAAI